MRLRALLGGPHENPNFAADVDGGRMDGFVSQAETKAAASGGAGAGRPR